MTDHAATPTPPPTPTPAPPSGTPIEPDTKDWTWVLDRPCPECGFVAAQVDAGELPDTVRSLTPRWRAALARPDVRRRPRPGVWSPLEYAAHVRDVNRIFVGRVRLLRDAEDPVFDNWDQDAAAVEGRYAELDPATVASELADAAEALATELAAVPPQDLERRGRRSNGSVFTVRTLGRYYLHDVVHHLHDVGA